MGLRMSLDCLVVLWSTRSAAHGGAEQLAWHCWISQREIAKLCRRIPTKAAMDPGGLPPIHDLSASTRIMQVYGLARSEDVIKRNRRWHHERHRLTLNGGK